MSNTRELKRVAELAAIRLNIKLQEIKSSLAAEGKQGSWDYACVCSESAKLCVAIGIIQDLYVE